jgi:thymidylate synthase (FAD)
MEVRLLAYTPKPDMVCAAAAFTSWKKKTTAELFEQLNEKEAVDFLKMVMGFGHMSVTEHAVFTFSISGVSRALTHQLVRHRLASYTQQSQRYVKFSRDEIQYVTPHTIGKDVEAKKVYDDLMEKIADTYEKLINKKIPPEDARFVLPNAATTNIVVTMNARELLHFIRMRTCERTQWELREVATEMLKQAKKVAPVLFSDGGPGCVVGPCPEGKLTCGKIVEVRKKFKEL